MFPPGYYQSANDLMVIHAPWHMIYGFVMLLA